MPLRSSSGRQLFAPAGILVMDHPPDAFLHGAQRFGGRQPVVAAAGDAAFNLLFEAGHAHLEELVEIGAGDAKELEPFQQGSGGIARLLQHPLVEFQPAQFAVEKPRRPQGCLSCLHDKDSSRVSGAGPEAKRHDLRPFIPYGSEHPAFRAEF